MRAIWRAFKLAGVPGLEPGKWDLESHSLPISLYPLISLFLYVPYASGTTCRISSILIFSQPFLLICEQNNLSSYILSTGV